MNKKLVIFPIFLSILFLFPLANASLAGGMIDGLDVSLDVDFGFQYVEQDTSSSKFNEYKDDETDVYINGLKLGIVHPKSRLHLDFRGKKISRDDQNIYLNFGSYAKWGIDVQWNEIPHLISNNAMTPYNNAGGGRYTVPDEISGFGAFTDTTDASTWSGTGIGFTHIEQANGEAWLRTQDNRVADVVLRSVHGTELGTQRKTGSAEFNYNILDNTKLRLEFGLDLKDGSIVTGAPIGDRPPRSMTVQLPEPLDYRTENFKVSLEHFNDLFQADVSYLHSQFENEIDAMTWDSLFYNDDAGVNFKTLIDNRNSAPSRMYSDIGRIPLNPDNVYQNVSFNVGVNLPMESRLNASFTYGRVEHNKALAPFATSDFGLRKNIEGTPTDWDSTSALPRARADAQIDTTYVNLRYTINPVKNLNFSPFFRLYDLNNKSAENRWEYITGDSQGTSFKNKRINLAYEFEKYNTGLDLSYNLGKAGTAGFGYEKEVIDREHREVSRTDEDIFKVSYRANPIDLLSLRARYLRGERDGKNYNVSAPVTSYWYTQAEAGTDKDNPLLIGWTNHPDMRKSDVSDRQRDQLDVSLSIMPTESINVGFSYTLLDNDYDSSVKPTTFSWTFSGTPITATSLGQQVGLLDDNSDIYTIDINIAPADRFSGSFFYTREDFKTRQRGFGLDEHDRVTSSHDWTNPDKIWNATIRDETDTFGGGANVVLIEDTLDLSTNYTYSRGVVDIDYSGGSAMKIWGRWVSPPDVEFETTSVKTGVTYHFTQNLSIGLHYLFEKYNVNDWQQQAAGKFADAMNEYYVRDTDSNTTNTKQDREGNRLVRMAGLLAPDYITHVGFLTLDYTW